MCYSGLGHTLVSRTLIPNKILTILQSYKYLCHSCSGWVHSKCSDLKDARQYKRTKDWACQTCSSTPAPPPTQPPPAPTTTSKPKDDTFNILQFNANGIGNKLLELEHFLEKHNVKVTAIQESKLTFK